MASNKSMKILVISPYMPWPLHVGSSVRIFNIIKGLFSRGHKITLLMGAYDLKVDVPEEIKSICEKIATFKSPKKQNFIFSVVRSIFSGKIYPALKFQSRDFRIQLDKLLKEDKFDFIFVNFSIIADMLPGDLKNSTPVVLDQHENEKLVFEGYLEKGSLAQKIFALLNLAKMDAFQRKVFSKVSAVLCVSEEEALLIDFLKDKVKIIVAPNGVSDKFLEKGSAPIARNSNTVVFCANMGVKRNIDAAEWFAGAIFPGIKKEIPKAEFWIVGSEVSKKILKLGTISGVKIIGKVAEIENYYALAGVFVAPYRFGAGTKLKVLEAMAVSAPVVSTTVGCRGIKVSSGKNILIADKDNDFSKAVIYLLKNPRIADELSRAGRELVREKYSWDKIVVELEKEIFTNKYKK